MRIFVGEAETIQYSIQAIQFFNEKIKHTQRKRNEKKKRNETKRFAYNFYSMPKNRDERKSIESLFSNNNNKNNDDNAKYLK